MPINLTEHGAELVGVVGAEDAEPLTGWLRTHLGGTVDLDSCTWLHTAALQALVALGANTRGIPADPFLAAHVVPLLRRDGGHTDPAGSDPLDLTAADKDTS